MARELHFGRAARQLGVAQPAVSQQIRKLEGQTGVKLLDRDKHSVRLTPAGAFLYREASRLLAEVSHLQQEMLRRFGPGRESLRIGFVAGPVGNQLSSAIRKYRKSYPKVAVSSFELTVRSFEEHLRAGRADLVLSPELAKPARRGLEHTAIGQNRVVVAVPATHSLAKRKKVPWSALRGQKFAAYSADVAPNYQQWIEEECRRRGVTPNFAHEVATATELLLAVEGSEMVAIVPQSYHSAAGAGVVFIPLEPEPEPLALWVWYLPHPAPQLQAFIECLRNSGQT